MSAYNWIIVSAHCPACGKEVDIRCQTHVASSYGGDTTGRFFDEEYRLGDPMRWWPRGHKKYEEWRVDGRKTNESLPRKTDSECCYASCPACKAELFVIIEFDGPRPTKLMKVGLEKDWPEDYWK